jgi:hypothetical protein
MQDLCPICGLTLARERQQLRQDDEPATLVIGCPDHGSAAELAVRFRSGTNRDGLGRIPSIRSSLVPEYDKFMVPDVIPVEQSYTLYAMRIMVRGDFDVEDRYYKVASSQCLIDGKINHMEVHTFNPVWCVHEDSMICKINTIERHSDLHAVCYKATAYASRYNCEHIGGTTHRTKYAIHLDIKTGVEIIFMRVNEVPSVYSVWYVAKEDIAYTTLDRILSCVKRSLYVYKLKGCELIADVNVSRWHIQVKHMKEPNILCTVYISHDLLHSDSQGEFKNGTGAATQGL